MPTDTDHSGMARQTGVWDRMAPIYLREIDPRFAPVIDHLLTRAGLEPGQRILDLGTGTGAVAVRTAPLVAPGGRVVGVDISPEMLALARERATEAGHGEIRFGEGRAEAIPADDATFNVVFASLSLMFAIDRAAAAREIARVLRPGGRLVAAVWAGPEEADIVLFQQIAGRFAPTPPVPGVGPGALGNPAPFLAQLAEVGIVAQVERETFGFDFANFEHAWDVLAGVTAAQLSAERQRAAREAVLAAMWSHGDGPRHFRNVTQFVVGQRSST